MYSVSRLFPAAELEALRGSIEGFTDEPPRKRRRTTEPSILTSTSTSHSGVSSPNTKKASISSSDSGYGSAPSDSGSPNAVTSPRADPETLHPRANSLPNEKSTTISLHNRSNTATAFSTHTTPVNQTSLFNRYLLSRQPSHRARYLNPSRPVLTVPSRFPPIANPTPPLEPTDKDYGWTAGPRLAATAATATRVFDGVRLTGDERTWLDSLLPEPTSNSNSNSNIESATIAPIQADEAKGYQETEKIYDGFAVSHDWEADEVEGEEEWQYEWAQGTADLGDGEVADFFKIEEACVEGGEVDGESRY